MKKIPLRVYFILISGLILLVVGVLLLSKVLTNHGFVKAYEAQNYNTEKEEKLLGMNFPESYVPYYNLGDAAYKRGDYTSAVSYFTKALGLYPTKERDCLVRINLALSLCNTIDFANLDSQDKVDTALFILYKARGILLEKGCATNEGEPGHNADAQKLKEDIDKMIEMLENPDGGSGQDQQQPPQSDNNNDDSQSGSSQLPSDKEKKIQKDLEKNKKNALEDRQSEQDDIEKWSDHIGGSGSDGSQSSDQEGDGGGQNGPISPW
ncbi:MAG: tetratricopeptide repeat protein [Butyrivibrio sp.]|nr:tetratricopeptide repeat protein [Butyrivibrio sp.]